MLNSHLTVKTNPIACPENIILSGDFRITVLSDRLIRVEKDAERIFEDGATQSVWYRNLGKQNFEWKIKDNIICVNTASVEYIIDTFDYSKSYAKIGSKRVAFDNGQNLLATARTLDGYDGNEGRWHPAEKGKIKLCNGVCSKSGVAVIDDSQSLILADDGKLTSRRSEQIDDYVFAFGHDYRAAVKALYDICGKAPLIPRYALGNWWSRYHRYTDKEYLHLLDDFARDNVPISVATIDMDWHYSWFVKDEKNIPDDIANDPEYVSESALTTHGGIGWTGYSWNKDLFPDYKAFLADIKKRDIKVTLNLHPAGGVRYWEDQYEEFCRAMNFDSSTRKMVPFDITNDDYINNYFKILHKPYERDGVDFWWIDWQQGNTTKLQGLDPLWSLNHYHYLDNAVGHDMPLIMSRYCGVGAHRYPLGFSGDTFTTWKSLAYLPEFTNRSSNIGYTWWSHDIGGHFDGDKDDEMMIRYVQYGVFNPIMRLHSTAHPVMSKEPDMCVNGTNLLLKELLRLRHRLVPYIYTANYRNFAYGEPLSEPIYYTCPKTAAAYKYDNNYMFGSELLVAPIVQKGVKNVGKVKAYLPKGIWTDIFNGNVYKGGQVVTMYRHLDTIPVLAREGAVIPMAKTVEGNCPDNPKELEVLLYKGNNEYTMYEDLGENSLNTSFKLENNGKHQAVKINIDGDRSVAPKDRRVTLVFKNIKQGSATVTSNGNSVNFTSDDNHCLTVSIDNFNNYDCYDIAVDYNELPELDICKETVKYYLLRAEDNTFHKKDLNRWVSECQDESKIVSLINASKCNNNTKNLLLDAIKYRV